MMVKNNLNDITVFLEIAREGNFTRAAAKLGVSPSALSHTLRQLEKRMGFRLLTRTTRSVTPTEAGERIITLFGPMIEQMEQELVALSDMRKVPGGHIRISADEYATHSIIVPKLNLFLPKHPDISVEISVDYGLTDIVAEKFDAGIRLGGTLANDMIAQPIGPEERSIVVATPGYLTIHGMPAVPQDLTTHRCINLRLPTYGGLYVWEFEQNGKEVNVKVEGQLTFNTIMPMLQSVRAGLGLAYLPVEMVQPYLNDGTLTEVLADWTPPFSGYYIYYPSRMHTSPAFTLLVEALRH